MHKSSAQAVHCNMDNSEKEMDHDVKESVERMLTALLKLKMRFLLFAVQMHVATKIENIKLTRSAIENCKSETVRQWLKENWGSAAFSQLADTFSFLKRHIDEEEGKLHSGHIDVIFIAHGSIRGSLVPARCLLPLPTITDVLLYAPWNCTMSIEAAKCVATGHMKPQDRVFKSLKTGCSIPSERHIKNFPDHWNSMKQAGDQKVPNIMLSPLEASEADTDTLKKLSQPDRNRIVIPYIDPKSEESTPFFIVTLALSLVLSPRFQATIHLATCLSDKSTGKTFDRDYLRKQYAYTDDNTIMTFSPDRATRPVEATMLEKIRRWFGSTPS